MKRMQWIAVCALAVAVCAAPAGAQVVLGQVDTFEDGTTQGWGVGPGGSPVPPTNATGGPAGADDNFLLLLSLGGAGGPGSRLVTFNDAQWGGDYLTAGIGTIQMDLNNLGPNDLFIRLLFADPVGGPPSNIAITDALFLPTGSGWVHATFDVRPASLITLLGTATDALANATELRIFHNPDPDFPGPPIGIPAIEARLGVDNIAAVPEPSAIVFLAAGGMGGIALLVRRRFIARQT